MSRNCNIYSHICSLLIITDYDVWFIVGDGSHSIIRLPYFRDLFLLILVRAYTSVFSPVLLLFPCICCEHSIMSFMYCSFAITRYDDTVWSIASLNVVIIIIIIIINYRSIFYVKGFLKILNS